jgi:hypothetical protein
MFFTAAINSIVVEIHFCSKNLTPHSSQPKNSGRWLTDNGKSRKMTYHSELRQAGIGQAPVSHFPATNGFMLLS